MIIAYASANADPISNPSSDPSLDLSSLSLPQTVQVYGGAQDTSDPSASFSWSWSVMYPESGVTLSDDTAQNPTVTCTEWRNVRLHLIATNTATAETSEANVLLAPSSSFVEVRVLSAANGLQKIARGSRSWHTALEEWADVLDASVSTLSVSDLSDVSSSTGTQLDQLTGGGVATLSGATLHTHTGAQVAVATEASPGVVQLDEASALTTPRVMVKERMVFSGGAELTVSDARDGTSTDKILIQSPSVGELLPHVVFYAHEDIVVTDIEAILLDGGTDPTAYTFDLAVGKVGALTSSALTPVGLSMSGTIEDDHAPLIISESSLSISVDAGNYFGVAVTGAPLEADAGRSLRVVIRTLREV